MSLFECENCKCVENTALAPGWWDKKLCSECNPEINKWHDYFPKKLSVGYLLGNDGFLYHKEELKNLEWRIKNQGFKIVKEIKKED